MVKYKLPYKSLDESSWELQFDFASYTGEATQIRGVAGQACTLQFDGGTDELWDNPMIDVKALMAVYNQGEIDALEILKLSDRDCKVTLLRNAEVKFKGYMLVDGFMVSYQQTPYSMNLTATSGLTYLEGMEFRVFGAEFGTRCPLNYFRRILMLQLGIDLPIRWSSSLTALNAAISGDPIQNLRWAQYGDGVVVNPTTSKVRYHDCKYILEGIVKALQCRVFQTDGAWWILGINEQLKDVIEYYECSNTTGLPVVTQHSRNIAKSVGSDYPFINEDANLTMVPGVGSVEVEYEHSQLENILPNGSLDQWSSGGLLWWGVDDPANIMMLQNDSITDRGGYAVRLQNISNSRGTFRMFRKLPIDAHTLFSTFQWGFCISVNSGFPLDSEGYINWSTMPLKASVKYSVNEDGTIVDYYLNEHGFWQKSGGGSVNILRYDRMTYTTNLPLNIRSVRVYFKGIPALGDKMVINMRAQNNNSNSYTDYAHIIDPSTAGDLSLALNTLKNLLPSRISSKSVTMVNATEGYIVYQDTIDNGMPTAYVTNYANTLKAISFAPDKKVEAKSSIAFEYRGAGSLENKFIDPGKIDVTSIDGMGLLSVEFFIEKDQDFILDEIWMKVNSNRDVYKAKYSDLYNAKTKNIQLNISSSFSGFMGSNLMQSYYSSDDDWKFTDGTASGSLTELYARNVMDCMYKPSVVFNGTINTRGKDWCFLDNYSISGLTGKFLPINPEYNTERNEVNLRAIEARNDSITYTVEHYGAEDEKNI